MKNNFFGWMVKSLFLSVLVFSACQKEDSATDSLPAGIDTPWFVLSGPVRQFVESQTVEGEEVEGSLTFDEAGRLKSYAPSPLQNSSWKVDMLSVLYEFSAPAETDRFEYDYDEAGRLTTIRQYALFATAPRVFSLTYGSHSSYVPLPFSFGGRPFYLIKGLARVDSEATDEYEAYHYVFNGTQAVHTEQSWMYDLSEVYTFEQQMPVQFTSLAQRNGQTLRQVVTTFSFGGQQQLKQSLTRVEQSGDNYTIRTDYHSRWQKPVYQITDTGATRDVYEWRYSDSGELQQAQRTLFNSQGQTLGQASLSMQYAERDEQGNWHALQKQVTGDFDPYNSAGSYSVRRQIMYYEF